MPKILTIIVTYNGMKWLDKCLASVKESQLPSDLYIVDNGSTDGSIDFIKKNYPEAIFVESKENLGFGKANNMGLKYAVDNNYDYVYLLNQDAWIEPDTLSKMIDASQKNPEYGILSPLQVNREKAKLDQAFGNFCPKDLISDSLCKQPLRQVYQADFVMAAHWLLPVDKLKVIGGFSPAFQHYGEDNNFIDRCIFKGYKLGVVPNTMGVHDRDNRPFPKSKRLYFNYVHGLALLNNPNEKSTFKKFSKRMLSYILHPSQFTFSYFLKSIQAYFASAKYKKMYQEKGPFLREVDCK